jgi:hypothetical protein
MLELGPYGSVRGARGNSHPYREPQSGQWLYLDLKPRFDLDHVWSVRRWVLKWSAVANMIRNKPISNHWFVSVETPKQLRLFSSAAPRPRETKSFPTEIEAKQFAIAMLSEGRKVTAGTLSPHQPKRRTITASEINQWIGEEE